MDIVKVILTSLLSILSLFIFAKSTGHKQVSQLDFFDYVSGITVGSIGAELATELEEPVRPLIAIAVWGAVSILLSLLTAKLPKIRKYVNGTPTVLMSGGKLYRENLKKSKIDLSEFSLMCRELGYFNPEEIETAIFEHNGRLSILPKSASRPATPKDLKIPVEASHVPIEVIMDGKVMMENLYRINRDPKWLSEEVRRRGYKDTKEIFFGIYFREEDKLTLYPNE